MPEGSLDPDDCPWCGTEVPGTGQGGDLEWLEWTCPHCGARCFKHDDWSDDGSPGGVETPWTEVLKPGRPDMNHGWWRSGA